MVKIEKCPYCGSENFEHMGDNDYWNGMPWHCHECDSWFDEDDCEHQMYWENISCLLNGTSIENPLVLEETYILPSIDRESQGLSDLEKLQIDKVHQIEGDGKMFYHFEYTPDVDECWYDMSELSTEDLKGLLEHLRKNKWAN